MIDPRDIGRVGPAPHPQQELLESAIAVWKLTPKRVPMDLAEALLRMRDAITALDGWEC